MSEQPAAADMTGSSGGSAATTAGGLLRAARQKQGLHLEALAGAIKVTPAKLEALEADRIDQLPDATFARALAKTVCRTLKMDDAPVLALLPPPSGYRIEQVAEGLNEPFRERPGRLVPEDWLKFSGPAVWGPALVLVAAAVVYFLPAGWPQALFKPAPSAEPAAVPPAPPEPPMAIASSAVLSAPSSTELATELPNEPDRAASAPEGAPAAAQGATAALPAASAVALMPGEVLVQFTVRKDSWVEVVDASGRMLLSRTLQPGAPVELGGTLPMKIKIGNASATQLVFRGQPMKLDPYTRDNIARLVLK